MGTVGCTLLLWAARLTSYTGKHMSISLFAFRCTTGGMLCVLLAAVVYQIVNKLSAPKLYLIVGSRRRAIEGYKQLLGYGGRRGCVLGFIDGDDSHSQYLPGDYLGPTDRLKNFLCAIQSTWFIWHCHCDPSTPRFRKSSGPVNEWEWNIHCRSTCSNPTLTVLAPKYARCKIVCVSDGARRLSHATETSA